MSLPTELKDRVVESAWLSRDRARLAIQLNDGAVAIFIAGGDCCARTWIEHAEVLDFKGSLADLATSGSTNPPELQDPLDADADLVDQEFITFKTTRGRLIVDLRTSHNGNYGGSLIYSGLLVELPAGGWEQLQ